jgi:hypothetical protein
MQFALEVAILECSFLSHSQGILGIKHIGGSTLKNNGGGTTILGQHELVTNFWKVQPSRGSLH